MAAKVFDGLFIGNAETSRDIDFLKNNKITRLINVAGDEVQNLNLNDLTYLNLKWRDVPDCIVFPQMEDDRALLDIVTFIDSSLRKGLSILIFSLRGVSRNICALSAYLMHKYCWSFQKCYDFTLSRKNDVQINRGFVQQLFALEQRLLLRRTEKLKYLTDNDDNNSDIISRDNLRSKGWDPVHIKMIHFHHH